MPTTLTDSDTLSLSDSVVLRLGNPFTRAVGDNLFLSDSLQTLVNLLSHPSDSLSLSDRLQIQKSIELILSDSLNLSDSLATPVEAVQLLLSLSDTLSLSDAVSTSSSEAIEQYLRRYLNDVS